MPGENETEQFQIPLMFAFREAARARDSQRRIEQHADGERVLSERSTLHRRGAAERVLRRDLSEDLGALVDTTDLASVLDLSHRKYVAGSVINYGLADFSHLTVDNAAFGQIEIKLRDSLLHHEPRLRADTLVIERRSAEDDKSDGRLRFLVLAEMRANPVDVAVEFVAEIDVRSGKLRLPSLDTTS